ncbi:MAG: hypothetical protein MK212_02090 [Saprospiraceae bacterium]|nr:hypothetical protein [Saprospiraceae bacterium]
MRYLTLLSLLTLFGLGACTSKFKEEKHELSTFRLVPKNEAHKIITTDTMENYFDKVTSLEMSIQMNINEVNASRDSLLPIYKKYLEDDVLEFMNREETLIKQCCTKALDYCQKINPKLQLPKEIVIIKIAGNCYGPTAYYTRENAIMIPAPQIRNADEAAITSTLIHEIAHIYSRYNKNKRDRIYKELGFQKLNKLELSPFLEKRVLYNPDGVDLAYAIQVTAPDGRKIHAIPVIYARRGQINTTNRPRGNAPSRFFEQMVFQFFEVQEIEGKWSVTHTDIGLQEEDLENYWDQIQRNTRYTIHPDEIFADNFKILALEDDPMMNETMASLDNDGLKLLDRLDKILKEE